MATLADTQSAPIAPERLLWVYTIDKKILPATGIERSRVLAWCREGDEGWTYLDEKGGPAEGEGAENETMPTSLFESFGGTGTPP